MIKKLDWPLIICYLFFCLIGWISIYSALCNEDHSGIFDFTQRYGMQFVWIMSSVVIALLILFVIDSKIYVPIAWLVYGLSILLLVAVRFLGIEVNGSHSWFELGPIRFQPAEIAKITTSLVLARTLGQYHFKLKSPQGLLKVAAILLVPIILIILQKETGSALIFGAFFMVLYREGISGWYLCLGILAILLCLITIASTPFYAIIVVFAIMVIIRGLLLKKLPIHILFALFYLPLIYFSPELGKIEFVKEHLSFDNNIWALILALIPLIFHLIMMVKHKSKQMLHVALCFVASLIVIFSMEFFLQNVLKEHQRKRIENLVGQNVDLQGAGYNVYQSKIAIGSGGFTGKGFMKGTQTKFNFVPEQGTDFIFCTVGEEWGFIGSTIIVLTFLFMIVRVILLAEKQKGPFNRVFGYCFASIIFMHFLINIGMTIGIMPVIGIPLPFVSYGGSSLWSFTIFLFIFIRLDLDRKISHPI